MNNEILQIWEETCSSDEYGFKSINGFNGTNLKFADAVINQYRHHVLRLLSLNISDKNVLLDIERDIYDIRITNEE